MPLDQAEINDLRHRILIARRGEGPMPGLDELRQVYEQLRVARQETFAARRTKRIKSKPSTIPLNLEDLFAAAEGTPKDTPE